MNLKYIQGYRDYRWLTVLACIMLSCKKFIDIPAPQTQIQTSEVFSNDQAATTSLMGLYSLMQQSSLDISNGGVTVYCGLTADEILNTAANADLDGYANNTISISSAGLNRFWNVGYKRIYQTNAILEGLEKSSTLTDSVKNQLRGETLSVRSLMYFYLVNLFGDVPLLLTTDYDYNRLAHRSSTDDIYSQVTKDLIEAKTLLKESYPSPNRARQNKWTAASLLARIYLYRKDWAKAEAEATDVIGSGIYSLNNNLGNVFLATSNETIWQLMPISTNNNTAEGNVFNPSSVTTRPTYAIRPSLTSAFETNDQRKANWIKSTVVSSVTYNYPNKYKVRTGAPPYTEYYIVFRVAELYLIRAEARNRQGNISGAKDDLNKIRNRAGLPNVVSTDGSVITSAIEKERQVELFCEWGHRWLDLKRSNRANDILSIIKQPDWQSTDVLFPIPLHEIETNPSLVQNPGY